MAHGDVSFYAVSDAGQRLSLGTERNQRSAIGI